MPIFQRFLQFGFSVYAVACLGSMLTMSLGAVFLGGLLLFCWFLRGPFGFRFYPALSEPLRKNSSFFFIRTSEARLYFGASLLLVFSLGMSLVWAWFFPLSYAGVAVQVSFLKDMGKAWYFFWPLFLASGLRLLSSVQQERVFRVWLYFFGFFSVIGIIQYYTGWPRPQTIPGTQRFHATIFLGHHLSLTSIFIFPFFACFQYAWQSRERRQQLFFGFLTFLGGLTLFLSYSRMFWVAFPVGLLLFLVWMLPRRWKLPCVALMLLLGAGLCQVSEVQQRLREVLPQSASVGLSNEVSSWVSSFSSSPYQSPGEHYSWFTRRELWKVNWEFFLERPFFGVGFRKNHELSGPALIQKYGLSEVFSGHAHNLFLDVLAGLGLFGFLSWFFWGGVVLWLLFREPIQEQKSWQNRVRVAWVCAWLVFYLNGLTQVNFWDAKVQHQLAWVIAWSLL